MEDVNFNLTGLPTPHDSDILNAIRQQAGDRAKQQVAREPRYCGANRSDPVLRKRMDARISQLRHKIYEELMETEIVKNQNEYYEKQQAMKAHFEMQQTIQHLVQENAHHKLQSRRVLEENIELSQKNIELSQKNIKLQVARLVAQKCLRHSGFTLTENGYNQLLTCILDLECTGNECVLCSPCICERLESADLNPWISQADVVFDNVEVDSQFAQDSSPTTHNNPFSQDIHSLNAVQQSRPQIEKKTFRIEISIVPTQTP